MSGYGVGYVPDYLGFTRAELIFRLHDEELSDREKALLFRLMEADKIIEDSP